MLVDVHSGAMHDGIECFIFNESDGAGWLGQALYVANVVGIPVIDGFLDCHLIRYLGFRRLLGVLWGSRYHRSRRAY